MTGLIYVIPLSPRAKIAMDIVKYYNLDFEIKAITPDQIPFKFKKVPYLVHDKNFTLHETLAVIEYLFSLVPEEKKIGMFGKTKEDYASIMKWNSLFNQELMNALGDVVLQLVGKMKYNKQKYDLGFKIVDEVSALVEERLSEYTYLVGERISIADIYGVLTYTPALKTCLDLDWAAKHPNIMRWFNTVKTHPMIAYTYLDYQVIPKKLTLQPPKKEKAAPALKKQQPAAAPKPKEVEDDAPVEEKKPKHPLEALGKPKVPIDEWKRVYSNEDTREKALPWFWENFYDPAEWSMYKVGYKYNDELTLTFMSNNLVGGFFNRLSASTKYLFGCLVVYGENNNNGIVGAFLVRGQDFKPAFEVAPDWESYEYTKLDPSSEADKEFINDMWAWDKPVIVGSESKEIADGKVFK